MLPLNRKYTYEEFLELSKDEITAEFINGEIFYQATPTLRHQRISGRIFAELLKYFNGSECEAFTAPFNIIFEKEGYKERVQPDLFVICGEKNLDDNEYQGIPRLIVEILSPSNSNWDYVKKMDLYARFGVKEYWIISPKNMTAEIFLLDENTRYYNEPIIYIKEQILRSEIFKDFSFKLKNIFNE